MCTDNSADLAETGNNEPDADSLVEDCTRAVRPYRPPYHENELSREDQPPDRERVAGLSRQEHLDERRDRGKMLSPW